MNTETILLIILSVAFVLMLALFVGGLINESKN